MRSAIVCLLASVIARPAVAQSPSAKPDMVALPAYRNRVLAIYDDAGDPLEGVEVTDVMSGMKAITTRTGTVSLVYLPEGGSLVRTRKIGYESKTQFIAISPSDTVPVMMLLSRATALPTVVVKDSAPKSIPPFLRGFEERRAKGFGHFITEDELRKNDEKTLAYYVASRMPGISSLQNNGGAQTFLVSNRKDKCPVTVYLDGVRIYDIKVNGRDWRVIPDFSKMRVEDYSGVEYYQPATVPVEFNATASDCGTLLLWTRVR